MASKMATPARSTGASHEQHFRGTAAVRDVVIGLSDGLTVPFALAAGSISMGLGGYLAARTESEHYAAELAREVKETEEVPDRETEEVAQVFDDYGLDRQQALPLVNAIRSDRSRWVGFMMRFELGLEKPDPSRIWRSALTIAFSYVAGGLIPLLPYMIAASVRTALLFSVLVTLLSLFIFGYAKNRVTGLRPWRGALQTIVIGGVAAGTAFAIARLVA